MKAVFTNPTALRIGMSGTLAAKRYRVVGRSVMGMDADGERYYWNEFNLKNADGDSATLVFEETERGGEWKLFIAIEPDTTMTAAEAAAKTVGDRMVIDSTNVCVSLVDESRIYFIEGEAPAGMDVGDVANYFNAESGNTMIVVSWTGDEVEYFRGITLKRGAVAQAFGVREYATGNLSSSSALQGGAGSLLSSPTGSFPKKALILLGLIVITFIFFQQTPSCHLMNSHRGSKLIAASKSSAKLGDTIKISGANWLVKAKSLVRISEVGQNYERYEFNLTNESGEQSVLIHGMNPGTDDWFHFTLLSPLDPMTPTKAAELHIGETINVDGVIVAISHIFQAFFTKTESAPDAPLGENQNPPMYGFSGGSETLMLIARWDSSSVQFLKGRRLSARQIDEAFSLSGQ